MWPSLLHQQPELPYREPEPVLVQEYQREVVARREVGGIQVEHALEFALRIFEHVRPIERDAEVSPLVQLRLATAHDLFGPPADRAREARLNEPEQRLADSELGQTGAIDELLHRARAVDVLQDRRCSGVSTASERSTRSRAISKMRSICGIFCSMT